MDIILLQISRECRDNLIKDTLNNTNKDLIDILYDNVNSEIFNVRIELYELKWIESHWKMITDVLEHKDITIGKKRFDFNVFRLV